MVRLNRLIFSLAALSWPLVLRAQIAEKPAQPDLPAILERLDRLERENRALAEEVRSLRAKLDQMTESSAAAAAPAERLEILDRRVEEQAQTKLEASQKFPIRLAGMALFNAFLNSRQSGGAQYPVTAAAPGPRTGGATVRQTIVGLEYRGPTTVWGGSVQGAVFMDFFPPVGTPGVPGQVMRLTFSWVGGHLVSG